MSIVKSSDDHLTFNADGSSKNILFQADGVQKASISSTGLFTSTTIDATVLTGNLPAISGASLTSLPSQTDQNFTNADHTKLDGIETSATADQSNAEIVAAVEAGSDSNTFTDADHTKLDGIEASADVTDATNVGTVVNGKNTIWIPANAMTPTESNGCADITAVETTAGRPDLQVLDFDDGADEHAQFTVAFPKQWNLGTVTFQAFWTSTATDTDGVSWGLQGVAMNDNETMDVAYGTAIVVDDACQSAAEELYVTAESSAITIAGTPADNDLTYFRIFRDVSDANDTATEDARLIGVKLFYTTDALNDA